MANIDWPRSLPQSFLISSLSESGADNVIRSPIQSGPAKTRRRSSAVPKPISGELWMRQEQYLDFQIFFTQVLRDGSLAFNMPDDIRGGEMEVKFTGAYSARPIAQFWVISLDLERQPTGGRYG